MKPRNAGALVAMAVAQSVLIESGAILSRRFSVNEVTMILENGCGRDMLVNGMIEISDDTPKYEKINITPRGVRYICQIYNKNDLVSYGVLEE